MVSKFPKGGAVTAGLLTVPLLLTITGSPVDKAPLAVAVMVGAELKGLPLTVIAPVTSIPPEVVSNFLLLS